MTMFRRSYTISIRVLVLMALLVNSSYAAPPLTRDRFLETRDSPQLLGNAEISITDTAFVPATLTITVGMTVTWLNEGSVTHRVVSGVPPTGDATPSATLSPTVQATGSATASATASANPTTPPTTSTATPLPSTTPTAATGTPTATAAATSTATAPVPSATVTPPSSPPSETPIATNTATTIPTPSDFALYLPLIQIDNAITAMPTSAPLGSPAGLWDSGNLEPGESFSFGFETIGTYTYYDPLYPQLVGQIVVVPPVVTNDPPTITIATPEESAVVPVGALVVSGTVTDSGTVVTVTVNDVVATLTGKQFEATISVTNGAQIITVVATDNENANSTASRVVQVDGTGPDITIIAPADGQAVYTDQPTIDATFDDFLSVVAPDTFVATITDESGATQDVTADLTVTTTGAAGTLSTLLADDAVYTLTLTIEDTLHNPQHTISTFYVPLNPTTIIPPVEPSQAGWVSGRVYDSTTCNEFLLTCDGLAGMHITLEQVDVNAVARARTEREAVVQAEVAAGRNPVAMPPTASVATNSTVSGTVVTGPDGFFAFPVADTAVYWLRAEKQGYTYGQREAEIVRERSTATSNIYLTPLDPAVTTCGPSGCVHTNSTGSMQLVVPAGAIPAGETRELSATPFEHVEFLPSGELPPNTWETYAFNLGGTSEVTFTVPITVRQANTRGFAPGTQIPLGFWNPDTQAWEHAGTGTVDATGTWIEMLVTHFSNYDCNDPIVTPDPGATANPSQEEPPCAAGTSGCFINIQTGEFEEWIETPPIILLNDEMAPQLRYSTARAEPSAVIDIDLALNPLGNTELGDYVQWELAIEGERTDVFTFALEDVGDVGRFRYYWNGKDAQGRALPPGLYEYVVTLGVPYTGEYCNALGGIFGNPPDCVNGATGIFVDALKPVIVRGTVAIEGEPTQAFGEGWTLEGHQRLFEDEDGNILITDGRHNDKFYFPDHDLVLNQPPAAELPLVWLNSYFNFDDPNDPSESLQYTSEQTARTWTGINIPVGDRPEDVVVSSDGAFAYATNYTARTLSVINTTTNAVESTITVGRRPHATVLSPDGTIGYVVSELDDSISVVNLVTRTLSDTIPVGDGPRAIAISADGLTAYTANYNSDTLSVVNLQTGQQTTTMPAGNGPQFVAVSPDNTRAYVVPDLEQAVKVIDLTTQTIIASIPFPSRSPEAVAFSPDGALAYITDSAQGKIEVATTSTGQIVRTINTNGALTSLTLTADGSRAYVNAGWASSDALLTINLATGMTTDVWRTCSSSSGLALTSNEDALYISCNNTDIVRFIPLAAQTTELQQITLSPDPSAMTLSGGGERAYVVYDNFFLNDTLRVVDLTTGVEGAPIDVEDVSSDIGLSPDEHYAYIAGFQGIKVVDLQTGEQISTIILDGVAQAIVVSGDGTTAYTAEAGTNQLILVDLVNGSEIASIPVGTFPRDIVLAPNEQTAYVTNGDDDTVSVVDLISRTEIATIPVGDTPEGITLSSDGSTAYVTNYYGASLSVIDLSTNAVIATVPVGYEARRVVVTADGAIAYVATTDGVYVVDLLNLTVTGIISNHSDAVWDIALPPPPTTTIYNQNATDYSVLTYDISSNTYSRLYADGTLVQFTAEGWHASTTMRDGRITTYTHDSEGRILTMAVTPPDESNPRWTWTFAYTNGALATITDPAGRVTTTTINAANHLAEVELPDGHTQGFTYDARGLMTHHRDANGAITQQVYNAYGRLIELIEPSRSVYDPNTDTTEVLATRRTFTPSDTSVGLINTSDIGDPNNPAPAVPQSADIVDRIENERGGVSGHTNPWGSWLDTTDALGRTTTHGYDARNNLTQSVEPNGDCRRMDYDGQGYLTELIEGSGTDCATNTRTTTYTYESLYHQIKTATDARGNTTTYIYDYEEGLGEAGHLIRIEYPDVADENGVMVTPTEHFTYNAMGLVETVADARGTETRYVYTQGTPDEASGGANPLFLPGVTPVPGLLTQMIQDEGGAALTTTREAFNGAGLPGRIVKPGGANTTEYEYDSMNRITTLTNAVGVVTTSAYDGRGNLLTTVVDFTPDGSSGRNVRTDYTYLPDDQPTIERTVADGLTVQQRTLYDLNGMTALVEDGRGYQTRYFYDDADQLIAVEDPGGYTTQYTYTSDGLLDTLTDAEGSITRHEFDAFNREITRVQDDGGINLTTDYTYDVNDNLLTETYPDGTETCYEYDALNRRTAETRDCGGLDLITTYRNTLIGDLAARITPRGIETRYERDGVGRIATETRDVTGIALNEQYAYDASGNLETVVNERGVESRFVYDALGRQTTSCADALGENLCTTITYDTLNHATGTTDTNGVITTVSHNAWGNKTSVTQDAGGLNAVTTYTYDNALNLTAVTDANDHTTQYTYGPRNEMVNELYADGSAITYAWNGRGNATTRIDQAGVSINHTYDGAGRLTNMQIGSEGSHHYDYDAMGRVTLATRVYSGHTTTDTMAYNPLGQVLVQTQAVDSLLWTTTYDYDYLTGQYTVHYPSGVARTWSTDGLERLAQVEDGSGNPIAVYTYDPELTFDRVTYGNGVITERRYDPVYRLTQITSPVADYSYGYDDMGHQLYQQRAHEPEQPANVYEYDGLYQLTHVWYGADSIDPATITIQESETTYSLDGVQNRLSETTDGTTTTYGPSDGNQLLNPMNRYEEVNTVHYSYDARGNLLDDGVNGYTYDSMGAVIGIDGVSDDATYIYNAIGRRVAKTVNGVTTYFLFDQDYQLLEERTGTNGLATRYTHGSRIDNLLTMERGGQTYYYHYDAQGNVTEMTDTAGSLVERYEYDSYGNVVRYNPAGTIILTSAIGNLHLYTGRYYDTESGNYDFRGRSYAPRVGRFLQMDPTGYVDGLNLYASYFAINATDPTGYQSAPLVLTGPTYLPEVEIISLSAYDGLGGGISVTVTGSEKDCCSNNTIIPNGEGSFTFKITAEAGIGVGGKVKVGGVGVDLAMKGPQIQQIIAFTAASTYCGGPYTTFKTCRDDALNFMFDVGGTAGLFSLNGSISVSGFTRLCVQSDPSRHGFVSFERCGNLTMEVKGSLLIAEILGYGQKGSYSLAKLSTDDQCVSIFKQTF